MAPECGLGQSEIIKRLFETSRRQLCLASEGRIEELLETGVERERLFAALDLTGEPLPELSALAAELAGNDRVLADVIRQTMDAIGSKLGQVKTGMTAVKAYGRY